MFDSLMGYERVSIIAVETEREQVMSKGVPSCSSVSRVMSTICRSHCHQINNVLTMLFVMTHNDDIAENEFIGDKEH